MWCDKCRSMSGVEKVFSSFRYWYCENCKEEIGGKNIPKPAEASAHCDCNSERIGSGIIHKNACSTQKGKKPTSIQDLKDSMHKAFKSCYLCGYDSCSCTPALTDLGCPWCGSKDTSHDCKPYHAYIDATGEMQGDLYLKEEI